jgi:hypothetical protein
MVLYPPGTRGDFIFAYLFSGLWFWVPLRPKWDDGVYGLYSWLLLVNLFSFSFFDRYFLFMRKRCVNSRSLRCNPSLATLLSFSVPFGCLLPFVLLLLICR